LLHERRYGELLRGASFAPFGPEGEIVSVATLPGYRRHPASVRIHWRTFPRRLAKAALRHRDSYDVLWIADPTQAALVDLIPHRHLVYECVDDHAGFWQDVELQQQIQRDENSLARRADLVIATSASLQARLSALNPRTVWIGNGTDVAYFSKVVSEPKRFGRPLDLPSWSGPSIGYYGAIGDWVDLDLIMKAARRLADCQFVLIGPSFTDVSRLEELSNIVLLGERPYDTLRGYLAQISTWVIPFKVNAMTAAVDPLKVYEYLAAGRRVVSTHLPELHPLSPFLRMEASSEAWIKALEVAVREGDAPFQPEPLMPLLERRDWAHLARLFITHLDNLTAPTELEVSV
jgi:hypothetical protein